MAVQAQSGRPKGSSVAHCVYEYKNPANVKSGERSQEITSDLISPEAGIWRHAQAISGHLYRIEAWSKHKVKNPPFLLQMTV